MLLLLFVKSVGPGDRIVLPQFQLIFYFVGILVSVIDVPGPNAVLIAFGNEFYDVVLCHSRYNFRKIRYRPQDNT